MKYLTIIYVVHLKIRIILIRSLTGAPSCMYCCHQRELSVVKGESKSVNPSIPNKAPWHLQSGQLRTGTYTFAPEIFAHLGTVRWSTSPLDTPSWLKLYIYIYIMAFNWSHAYMAIIIMLRLCITIVDPIHFVWFVATLTVPYAEYGEPLFK